MLARKSCPAILDRQSEELRLRLGMFPPVAWRATPTDIERSVCSTTGEWDSVVQVLLLKNAAAVPALAVLSQKQQFEMFLRYSLRQRIVPSTRTPTVHAFESLQPVLLKQSPPVWPELFSVFSTPVAGVFVGPVTIGHTPTFSRFLVMFLVGSAPELALCLAVSPTTDSTMPVWSSAYLS
jgi:hypothetical protein